MHLQPRSSQRHRPGQASGVHPDTSWAIGSDLSRLAGEIGRHGIGADRLLFASGRRWGDSEPCPAPT